jgi:hypothetical protein
VALPLRRTSATANAPATPGCPALPDLACVVVEYSVVRIVCTVPPGAGVGFSVLVRNFWTALSPGVGFPLPEVVGVAPAVMPVRGGPIVVRGANFGLAPCVVTGPSMVQLQLTQLGVSSSVRVGTCRHVCNVSHSVSCAL